jgi:hypothetical protein
MSRAASIKAFRQAMALLKTLDPDLSIYVANSTVHLMKGPTHTRDASRPLHHNSIDADGGVRISGGDW